MLRVWVSLLVRLRVNCSGLCIYCFGIAIIYTLTDIVYTYCNLFLLAMHIAGTKSSFKSKFCCI